MNRLWQSKQARPARPGIGARIAWLAAVLAILLQTFTVQTHVHAYGPSAPGVAAFTDATGFDVASAGAHDLQPVCAICGALAQSNVVAPPTAASILEPDDRLAVSSVLARHLAPLPPAHPWRSRAPPLHS